MMNLGEDAGGPLYQQIRQDLFARIRRGDFAPGDLLPSENQICEAYNVSLTTARRALLELVKEGVVRRRAGIGTIVASRIRAAHLAFVSIDTFGDPWRQISSAMGELIAGVGEHAWQRNASFSMFGVDENRAEQHLRDLVDAHSTDGVLLRTANDIREEQLRILENAGMPYVVIKRQLPGRAMSCVVSDDFLGAQLATTHLLEQGHTRIAFVCAKPALLLTQERLAGYRHTLEQAGLQFSEGFVRIESSFSDDAGYRAVLELLQLPNRPTAIFTSSDTMAIGGYRAARALELSIPDDVAFIGYDDIAPAALLQPALTTVRTAYYDFGNKSTELLLNIIDGQTEAPQRIMITPELIVRDSTGARPENVRSIPLPHLPLVSGNVAKHVVIIGRDSQIIEAIRTATLRTGAILTPSPVQLLSESDADACICCTDVGPEMENGFSALLADGESAAQTFAKRHAGTVILIALGPGKQHGPVLSTAIRAGLERLTEMLATRWTSRGVRINTLLVTKSLLNTIDGLLQFLINEASAQLTGQVFVLRNSEITHT
jgi:DNA-binding LacI/PurR family transcriptional regulator